MSNPKSYGEIPTWRFGPTMSGAVGVPDADGQRRRRSTIHYELRASAFSVNFESRSRIASVRSRRDSRGLHLATGAHLRRARPYYDHVEYAIGVSGAGGVKSVRGAAPA